MYDKYFGLNDKPFSIAPDPRYLYMSDQHREALAHLVYGVGDGGGFVLLTGEVGTGKTTVSRCLLEQLPADTHIAFILNPKLSATELLATVCDELHIEYPEQPTLKQLSDCLNDYLLESHAMGKHTVLMIDEAQNLEIEVLEQIRLLTNLETNKQKLLQIILIGQPELKELLGRHELRQLAQRITARFHLRPLSQEECTDYIVHRLSVSGFEEHLFEPKAIEEVFKRTAGVPRLINVLCDRAMLGAYAKNRKSISAKMIKISAAEVMGGDVREYQADVIKPSRAPAKHWKISSVALVVLMAVIIVFGYTEREKLIKDQDIQIQKQNVIAAESSQVQNKNAALEEQVQQLLQEKLLREQQLLPFLPANVKPTDQSQAFTQLFLQWGLDYNPELDSNVCDFAKTHQKQCESDSVTWNKLNRIDRPVVLELQTEDGQKLYGVLLQLQDNELRVDFSGKQYRLSRQQIGAYWTGNIFYIWNTPADYLEPIKLAMHGRAVQWLKTHIAKLDGVDLIVPPDAVYDYDLQQSVVRFQSKYALGADGVAGPLTFITLNSLFGNGHPTLALNSSEGP